MRSSVAVFLVLVCGAALPAAADDHVFGDPAIWDWAPSRSYHVENYLLKLYFDQAAGEVFGDETVTLRPFAAGFRRFHLDSSDLSIDSVSLQKSRGSVALVSESADPKLWITLDHDYGPQDELKIRIVYHGKPRFGLFFVNPSPSYPDTPREIWTQGESEFNHHWFPCWDYPNDMATSELIVTVPEGQVAVSNGSLAHVSHAGGQVTYDWVEEVPHSSYLTSLAIGPWEKVHDSYHGKPVDYYAPRGTDESTVRRAFGLTPDMIGFYSRTFLEYPFEKYAQTAVHDFYFGGQENVSATTLQEAALQDAQAAEDFPVTEVVAHELGQHWFGDYVQGRDWADIWLNEGFATYLPALYTQYHLGYDDYRMQMLEYQGAALAQDRDDYLRPIVDRHYSDDGMQMFDAITHEKGAAVLDMLRYLLDGPVAMHKTPSQDEPLFHALHQYLESHAAHAVDTATLLATLQESTGRDLGQFFREWVYTAGTPAYKVSASYDSAAKAESVRVVQTQQGADVPPVFHMPIMLAFHGARGESQEVQVEDEMADQSFNLPLSFEPLWVDFDPEGYMEKSLDFPQGEAALAAAAAGDPAMPTRLWAVGQLAKLPAADADGAVAAITQVLSQDGFYGVRAAAAAGLGSLHTPAARQALLANQDQKDSRVRAAVFKALGAFSGDADVYQVLGTALQQDRSYAVRAAAAASLGRSGEQQAFGFLQAELAKQPEVHVARALLGGIAATGDPGAIALLFTYAQAGQPVRLRLSALSGLAALHAKLQQSEAERFTEVMTQALQDPYLPLQLQAQDLVASLHLLEFKPQLSDAAQHAPSLWLRVSAESDLKRLEATSASP